MSIDTTPQSTRPWVVHDVLIGVLAGSGVGSLVGAFVSTRWLESGLIVVALTILGAILGVLALQSSHRHNDHFITAAVIAAWVALAVSGIVLITLALAIATFT